MISNRSSGAHAAMQIDIAVLEASLEAAQRLLQQLGTLRDRPAASDLAVDPGSAERQGKAWASRLGDGIRQSTQDAREAVLSLLSGALEDAAKPLGRSIGGLFGRRLAKELADLLADALAGALGGLLPRSQRRSFFGGLFGGLLPGGGVVGGLLSAFGFDDMANDRAARRWGRDFFDQFTQGAQEFASERRPLERPDAVGSGDFTLNVNMEQVRISADRDIRLLAEEIAWHTQQQLRARVGTR